jgi:hypothetical protein
MVLVATRTLREYFSKVIKKESMMKKVFLILVIALALIMTVPALAASKVPTGEHIRVDPDGAVVHYPENTPFHIRHGWHAFITSEEDINVGYLAKAGFSLEIDSAYVEETYIDRVKISEDPVYDEGLYKFYFFNFPNGMTGVHTFTGHWYVQCEDWQEECVDPKEIIEPQTRTITIIFDSP